MLLLMIADHNSSAERSMAIERARQSRVKGTFETDHRMGAWAAVNITCPPGSSRGLSGARVTISPATPSMDI